MLVRMSENKHPDSDGWGKPVFAVRIHPQRSLTPRGVSLVLMLTALVSFLVSMPFVLLGAWPIAGFFGLDVLLLWLAFRIQAREARAYEEIIIARPAMVIRNVSAKGQVAKRASIPIGRV